MNIHTGREFPNPNPQDDNWGYPVPPPGFRYNHDGSLVAKPKIYVYACDQCGIKTIPGNRYHCTVCEDYDMCESCYRTDEHDSSHPITIYKNT